MITSKDIILRNGREVVCRQVKWYVRYFRFTYDTSMTRLENKRSSTLEEYKELKRLWSK